MKSSQSEIDRIFKLQSAPDNLQALKIISVKDRMAKIRRVENYLTKEHNRKKLIEALHIDLRKPAEESLTNEYVPTLITITHILKNMKMWVRDEYVEQPVTYSGLNSFIRYEPKGIVLIISPWNYPFQLTINPLLYAIAAGNAVIIKPSEFSSATSSFMNEMVKEIFTENEVCVLEGDESTSTALLAKPFNHIHFTGSPAVGKVVMKAASQNLTSVTLELGGKSPLIIDENTDIKWAAEKTAWAKTMNCGQTCIAPDYLLIHESLKKDFIFEYEKAINKFYNSDKTGIEQSKLLARIINSKNFNRIKGLVDDAVSNGAQVVYGGPMNEEHLFISPSIIDNIKPEMSIMKEEIFGPVLPLITFRNISETIKTINDLHKPLVLYILSKSNRNINFVIDNTSAGSTSINELMLTVSNPYLPFGGANHSGIGKSNGKHGFISFSNERGMVKRKWGTLKMLYPPYNKTIINWLVKLARL